MKFKLLSLLFLIQLQICKAQSLEKSNWLPQIVSANEKLPLSSATIRISQDIYFPTDENGFGNIPFKIMDKNDTITISHLGFISQKFLVSDFKDLPKIIALRDAKNTLGEISIVQKRKKTKTILVGPDSFSISQYLTNIGNKYALYHPTQEKEAFIKEIIIKMGNKANGISNPFKISLLNKKAESELPFGTLMEGFVVRNLKGESNFKIDISYLSIKVPKNGFFIVVEMLPKEFYSNDVLKIHGWKINKLPSLKCSSLPKKFDNKYHSLIYIDKVGWRLQPSIEFQFQAKLLSVND